MDQLRKVFGALTLAQRIGIILTVIALVAGVTAFVRWRHEGDFRPLFTGMTAEDAAGIVQKLKESGVEHRIAENGTSILVPAAKVDELRLEMAGAGLPRTGRIGFELFDKTNLGITDFTEHVNYRRALEGELERSIRSLSEVEQARTHISFPKDSVFLDAREPAKASVLLTLRRGARLSDSNILAITNLVASAVEGLDPSFVSVVDMRGNLLSRPKKSGSDSSDSSESALDYKHQVEKDLLAKVQSTLNPLLGEDRFRLGISAECDFSTSEQTDETYDPSRSVMSNSQKSEDLAGNAQATGVPGTPSNLPRPTSRPSTAGSNVSRRTENVSYETSRTVRQVEIPRGTIKRLSASLLIDEEVRWEGSAPKLKRVVVPQSPEKLKAIRDIVAGVIGLTPARGDQLIVQSLAFKENREIEAASQVPAKPLSSSDQIRTLMKDPKILIGAGVAALLLIGLLLFALTRRKKPQPAPMETQARVPAPEARSSGSSEEIGAAATADKAQLTQKTQQALQLPEVSVRLEALRQTVRENVHRDPALAAGVIRTWIGEEQS